MLWEDFLYRMHVRTGCPKELVRIVMEGIPETLMELEVGDRAITPLGTFKMLHRKARMINYFGKTTYYPSPEMDYIRLDIHERLRRTPQIQEDESTIEFTEESIQEPELDE